MRAIIAILLIGLCIAAWIFIAGSWSCHQQPEPNVDAQHSEQAKTKYCATNYGTFEVGLRDTGPFIKSNKEEITAFFTAIIAIFTIILGVFTVSLSKSTRIAALVAKDALEKLERAFVYSDKFEWKAVKKIYAADGKQFDTAWAFQLTWKNSGSSQAKSFVNRINWDTWLDFDGDLPFDFNFFAELGNQIPATSTFVAPESSILAGQIVIDLGSLKRSKLNKLGCLFGDGQLTSISLNGATKHGFVLRLTG